MSERGALTLFVLIAFAAVAIRIALLGDRPAVSRNQDASAGPHEAGKSAVRGTCSYLWLDNGVARQFECTREGARRFECAMGNRRRFIATWDEKGDGEWTFVDRPSERGRIADLVLNSSKNILEGRRNDLQNSRGGWSPLQLSCTPGVPGLQLEATMRIPTTVVREQPAPRVAEEPQTAEYLLDRAEDLFSQQRYHEAQEVCRKALAVDPTNERAKTLALRIDNTIAVLGR